MSMHVKKKTMAEKKKKKWIQYIFSGWKKKDENYKRNIFWQCDKRKEGNVLFNDALIFNMVIWCQIYGKGPFI